MYVNTSNNINTRLLLILLRFQMTGAATPCYWSDSQPTLNPDILIFQYYAKPTMPRLMQTSHVIRKQWVFVIDQIISDLAHSFSPRINYFHPQQHGSILTHWCGNECQPPTVLQNPIYNCPPLFFGVGRHPVDYFSFEGTKRWWVENGPRGVWTWSGPAWAAFREALWQTWREKQSTAIFLSLLWSSWRCLLLMVETFKWRWVSKRLRGFWLDNPGLYLCGWRSWEEQSDVASSAQQSTCKCEETTQY